MSNFITFQTQLVSIMELLAKAAVAEINRSVEDSCAVFRLEISQSQKEIETLKHKLQVLERDLLKPRRKKTESLFVQDLSIRPRRGEKPSAVEEVDTSVQLDIFRNQFRPLLIKKERLEEDCYIDPQPSATAEEQVTQPIPVEEEQEGQPTPAGDADELSEQHRCEHGDEELSGLEFAVKAEQEEEHVAHRLNQTGCEHSAERLNNLGSEFVMYERDSQLWTSFTQGDSDLETGDPICCTEQCSPSLPIHRRLQHTPPALEVSGSALSSFGASYFEKFGKMSEKPSVFSEELRSEAIHTQQGQYRERLVQTVERENQTLLPQQQQQHGPSVTYMRGSQSPAQPHSVSQYETSSTLSTSAFNAGIKKTERKMNTYQREFTAERRFCCTFCWKSFTRLSHLKEHQRCHTGEKPYSCTYCAKRFSVNCNLIRHKRTHTGEKPFCCTHCGMCFAQQSSLMSHQRIHTGEKPFICSQCGKSFAQSGSLKKHHRVHNRNGPVQSGES